MITILCSGSRGDIQPYIALAQRLKALGKQVRITSAESTRAWIEGYGLKAFPVSHDLYSLSIDKKVLDAASSADSPLKMLLSFRSLRNYANHMVADQFEACRDSELVVYHPGCSMGYVAAEYFGIPSVLASPFPIHRTDERLSVLSYGRFPSTRVTRFFSHRLLQGMLYMASKDAIKLFFRKRLEEPLPKVGLPYELTTDEHHQAVISTSEHIFSRPADWDAHIHQYGYWFTEENEDYQPPERVVEFLAAGKKPIYVGFGSMGSVAGNTELTELVVGALKRTGQRAIICGMSRIDSLPEEILAVDSIPHSWLFERVAAVCHHGGAGTSAAGFRAGIPTLFVPFSNDQFAWAHRAFELGVAPRALPRKGLSEKGLSKALLEVTSPKYEMPAQLLSEAIRKEDGALECARQIAKMC